MFLFFMVLGLFINSKEPFEKSTKDLAWLKYIFGVFFLLSCQWFSLGSSTNKTDHHEIAEILLKEAFLHNKP